jgi:hypothetical protein
MGVDLSEREGGSLFTLSQGHGMGVFLYPPRLLEIRRRLSRMADPSARRPHALLPYQGPRGGTAMITSLPRRGELSSGSKPDMHAVPWITIVNLAPKRAASRHATLIKSGEWWV